MLKITQKEFEMYKAIEDAEEYDKLGDLRLPNRKYCPLMSFRTNSTMTINCSTQCAFMEITCYARAKPKQVCFRCKAQLGNTYRGECLLLCKVEAIEG